MQKTNRPRLGKVKNCIFGWVELHFKKTNVFLLVPIEIANREFMGDFCAHLAKMHPLWTITDQSSIVQMAEIVQNAYDFALYTA